MICGITIMAYDIRQHGSSDERNIVYSVLCSFKFNKNAFIFEFISAKWDSEVNESQIAQIGKLPLAAISAKIM